jgi:O-antigen/teichoic acid export membrane protein
MSGQSKALRLLAGDTVLYGLSSIVGRLLNYLLVPIYTAVFAAGEYGIVTKVYAFVAFLNVIYTYGLETAYFRFASQDPSREPAVFRSAVSSILLTSLLLSGSIMLFAGPIASAVGIPESPEIVYWFASILAIDAIVAIPFARLRLQRKAKWFVAAKMGNILLNVGLNLFFIVFAKAIMEGEYLNSLQSLIVTFYKADYGVEYVFLSNLIANAFLILFLWKALSDWKLSLDFHMLKPMLRYAYPLLFLGLAGVTNDMLSRAMFEWLLPEGFYPGKTSLEALGIFGACFKLAIFMNLTVQAFRYASEPFFFAKAKETGARELYRDAMHAFVILACFILLSVSINLDLIGLLLRRPEYREGLDMVPWLLLAYLFLGVYWNLSIWYKLSDKTHYGTWISIGGALVTIVLNILLVPKFGYMGSAFAAVGCYMSMTLITFWLGQRHFPVPYLVQQDMLYIVFTMCLTLAVMQLNWESTLTATSFHLAVMLAFMALVLVMEKKRWKKQGGF